MTDDYVPQSYTTSPTPVAVPGPQSKVRKPKRRQNIIVSVFLVLMVALGGLLWLGTRHSASGAKAGDCVRTTGSDSVETVACDDPSAAFKVVGRVEDQTQTQATLSSCDPFQDQGAEQVYWSGEQGGMGFVLCLAPLH